MLIILEIHDECLRHHDDGSTTTKYCDTGEIMQILAYRFILGGNREGLPYRGALL